MFVSLNSFVKNVVSLPVYVNVAHIRAGGFSGFGGGGGGLLRGGLGRHCCGGCCGYFLPVGIQRSKTDML
jgi:hypothetical protein